MLAVLPGHTSPSFKKLKSVSGSHNERHALGLRATKHRAEPQPSPARDTKQIQPDHCSQTPFHWTVNRVTFGLMKLALQLPKISRWLPMRRPSLPSQRSHSALAGLTLPHHMRWRVQLMDWQTVPRKRTSSNRGVMGSKARGCLQLTGSRGRQRRGGGVKGGLQWGQSPARPSVPGTTALSLQQGAASPSGGEHGGGARDRRGRMERKGQEMRKERGGRRKEREKKAGGWRKGEERPLSGK